MDVTITLSDTEVAALTAERLNDLEALSEVIRRQINPLVERLISNQFSTLFTQYSNLSTAQKIVVLGQLQAIARSGGT